MGYTSSRQWFTIEIVIIILFVLRGDYPTNKYDSKRQNTKDCLENEDSVHEVCIADRIPRATEEEEDTKIIAIGRKKYEELNVYTNVKSLR